MSTRMSEPDWHRIADERAAEIVRLSALLAEQICPACGVNYDEARTEAARYHANGCAWFVGGPCGCGADLPPVPARRDRLSVPEPAFAELDGVRVLTDRLVPQSIALGAIGTIVHVYRSIAVPGEGYEVEFTDDDGKTTATLTMTESELEKHGQADDEQ